jgi:hypothetical protein
MDQPISRPLKVDVPMYNLFPKIGMCCFGNCVVMTIVQTEWQMSIFTQAAIFT